MPDTKLAPVAPSALRSDAPGLNERLICTVIAQVQFGQATRRCRGTGICRIDLNIRNSTAVFTCSRAVCRAGITDAGIVLIFDRHALCKQLVHKYFCNGEISLREDLELGATLCQKLGILPAVIAAGKYALLREGSQSLIIFEKASLRDKKPNHRKI
ncbi:MAG: hypothetical protein ACOYOO_05055 [Saprospiraceae bacterium]|jgi:hypothetical protein